MKILIKDTVVETKEITDIRTYERDRFYNRYCGFVVYLYKKSPIIFEWDIPYESYPHQISSRKERCNNLMLSIIAEWEKDKVIYEPDPIVNIKHFNM